MPSYTVMARPEDATREAAVFVADRFGWWAAIFGPFWALANRMWIVAIVLGCATIIASLLPPPVAAAVNAALLLTAGVFAADLKIWSLRRRGFEEQASLMASSEEEAELRYYMGLPVPSDPATQSAAPTAPPKAILRPTDPLGLFGVGG